MLQLPPKANLLRRATLSSEQLKQINLYKSDARLLAK